MRYTTLFLTLSLSAFFLMGCEGEKNPYGTVFVEGTVTFDGAPIEGVHVTMIAREGEQSAGGITDAKGKFTVTTGGSGVGTGAKPGMYDVTFFKVEMPPLPESPEAAAKQARNTFSEPKYLIPQRYENPKTSGIEPITVSNNKTENKFTFELKSQ